MSRTPEPRPALRRADDGSVHPAAPKAEPPTHLHAAPVPTAASAAPPPKSEKTKGEKTKYKPGDLRARKAAKEAVDQRQLAGSTKDEFAKLRVSIPKTLRKAARKRADADNTSVDAVVADALAAWLPR